MLGPDGKPLEVGGLRDTPRARRDPPLVLCARARASHAAALPSAARGNAHAHLDPNAPALRQVVPVEKASEEAWAGVAAVDRGESDENAMDWG